MASGTRIVEINLQVFEVASRGAALDRIDIARYLEILVMRDADYIRTREFLGDAVPERAADGCKRAARLAA